MLQKIELGQYTMYRTIKTELRAWVENPLFPADPTAPVYLLCEIHDADAENKTAHVESLDAEKWVFYSCPFSLLHTIHDYAPELNQVMRVHGEPK